MRIGLDIGGTKVRIGLIDRYGRAHDVTTVDCPSHLSKEDFLARVMDLVASRFSTSVSMIGVGVPAVVDEDGVVYDCVNIPSWDRVELKAILEDRFGIPVQVNNDCNCFARGVMASKYGRKAENLVCMTIGTGVGAGLVLGGKLYTGKNSCAGEIGCIQYKDHDYEYYCSSQFFIRLGTTAKDEAEKAAAGDENALKLWDEFGTNVGDLINMVTFAYDPQVIVIGGGIASAFGLFEKAMRRRMADFPYSNVAAGLKVLSDPSGDLLLVGSVR